MTEVERLAAPVVRAGAHLLSRLGFVITVSPEVVIAVATEEHPGHARITLTWPLAPEVRVMPDEADSTLEARPPPAGARPDQHRDAPGRHLMAGDGADALAEVVADLDERPAMLPPETAETKTFHLLACLECGNPERPLPMPFGDPAERGKWASEHTRATGHDRWRVWEETR